MAEEEIRLNKYLSEAGICSRREADRCIEAGKVLVNGKVAGMGQKVKMWTRGHRKAQGCPTFIQQACWDCLYGRKAGETQCGRLY